MSTTYRVGMIGCGRRAYQHLPGLLTETRCEIVAVADIKEEAGKSLAEKIPNRPQVYTDYHSMFKKEKIDVVVCCLWTAYHFPVFRDSLQYHIQAFHCEKPMAPTWGESLAMAELAKQTGCQLTFAHQRRFCPGNQMVRRFLQNNIFGKIEWMDLYSPPHLLDCGTHSLDQALSFNQEIPVKWVLGAIDTREIINYFDVKAEGMAMGYLEFQNGIKATLQVGRREHDMPTGVRIRGDQGFIEVEWDGQIRRAVLYRQPSWQPPSVDFNGEQVMIAMIKDIFDSLTSGRESEVDYRKALRAAEAIFAFYESVRQHKRIDLPISIQDNPFLSMLNAGMFN